MLEALEQVATGEVTVASRDVELDGVDVRKGAWLGLARRRRPSRPRPTSTRSRAPSPTGCSANGREVLTLLTGDDEPELDELLRRHRGAAPGGRARRPAGGQPHYPLLLSAE